MGEPTTQHLQKKERITLSLKNGLVLLREYYKAYTPKNGSLKDNMASNTVPKAYNKCLENPINTFDGLSQ